MRVLIAFDKFKDAIGAHEACATAATVLQSLRMGNGYRTVVRRRRWVRPCSRRGRRGPRNANPRPWTARHRGRHHPGHASNDPPDSRTAQARLGTGGDSVAVIEIAAASGLALVPTEQRDPWTATSVGTREVLRAAAAAAPERSCSASAAAPPTTSGLAPSASWDSTSMMTLGAISEPRPRLLVGAGTHHRGPTGWIPARLYRLRCRSPPPRPSWRHHRVCPPEGIDPCGPRPA